MSDKKTIAVIGATGAQGGGLVRSILNDNNGDFRVRAITRNVDSDKARALAMSGAEVVSADLDNAESIKDAFKNAYGVFAVTNFWEHFSPEKEISQIKNIAEAAKSSGVKHVIFSTLEDTRNWVSLEDGRMPTLMGKYKVPHFDGKGEAEHFFTDLNVPVTFLLTSFYWDNFIYFGMEPKKGEDGKYALNIPMGNKKLPGIAAEDIGKCAYGIFKNGNEYIGKKVGIAGEHLTGKEMADAFSRVYGKEFVYNAVPFDVFRGFGFPGAEDLGNMFQFKHDFEDYFCGIRKLDESKSLNPDLQSFEFWLKSHKDKIPME
ncbi:MAG: NmrA/HSCARG family protein [Ignavibacteriae bacterium]|nr:NmrA/HSCARG family protein [Ignavibacteriota bacterium]